MKYLKKREIDSLSIAHLEPERQQQIMAIKNGIALNYASTLDFASSASQNLTEFSSDLLRTVKVKDTPEVSGLIGELLSGLEKVDANTLLETKPSFFRRLFKVDEVKQFIASYDDIEGVIDGVKDKLADCSFQLKKDISVCERYYEQNIAYINELDNYIMAGKMRIHDEREALAIEQANIDPSDMLAVHDYNARKGEVDRLDRKVHDLMLMREIAIQNIPQIMLIRDGDAVLIEKIQSSINSAIPLWESQMVIAIQLLRQKGALAIQKSVTQTTNNLIAKNSELLKQGSVEVAKELESGIVDVAVLKKNSENLIATLEAIKKVREEGAQNRLKAAEELGQIQLKLNEQLLLASGSSGGSIVDSIQ